MNYHRRHDTRQQLGISAGEADELQERYEKEALDRKGEGGKKAGRGRPQKDVATSPHPIVGRKSRDDLGKAFGVSGRTAERGKNVVKKGVPELKEAVVNHEISLAKAERIAKLPKPEQPAAMAREKEQTKRPASQPKTSERPASKTLRRPTMNKLEAIANELFDLINRPTMIVSYYHVREKVKELREVVSRIVS